MNKIHYLLIAVTGVLYIWHSISLPYGIMFRAPHDDGWFMHRAMNLLHGDWFGPYNQMALIKGPVYPVFLALTSAMGVSLQFSTAFMHLMAACTVTYSLSEYLKSFLSKYAILILLLISQFPVQRVIRDEFSLILLLLIFSLTVIVFFNEKTTNKNIFSALLGVLLGLFMLTREDGGLTAIPILLCAVFLSLIKGYSKESLKKTVSCMSILIFLTILTNVLYKSANYLKYDSYVGAELIDPDYSDALSAIYSVREGEPQRHVEVTNANLEAIYQISPTFRSLEAIIEATSWRDSGCAIDKSTCGQLGTGYFMWALRDVMSIQGYYATPETAKINYRKITSEIRAACEVGKIKCANKYFSKIPGYELFDFEEFIKVIITGIKTTLYLPRASNEAFRKGVEGSEKAAEFLNISHYILPEPKWIFYKVNGWYYDKTNPNSWFDAKITSAEQSSSPSVDTPNIKSINEKSKLTTEAVYLVRQPSPDIANAFHDNKATMQRFEFYAPCTGRYCILSVNKEVIGGLHDGIESKYHTAGGIFYIDTISDVSKQYLNKTIANQKASSTNRYNFIAKYYNRCTKALFVCGIVSTFILILLGLKKRRFETPVLIIIVLWFIYFWRIIFLSLVTFFWIPNGINYLYLYPSIVILPIASFMSIYILSDSYWKQFAATVIKPSRENEEIISS